MFITPQAGVQADLKAAKAELQMAAKREQAILKMSAAKEAAVAKFVEKWTKQQMSKLEKSLKPTKRRKKRK